MTALFERMEESGTPRVLALSDPASGLRAFIAIDSVTLGPGAGGVRTLAYPSEEAALADASRLARAMTLKCSIAGLDAGGAKAVVLLHPGLDRQRAFERLGRHVEELGGLFRTAGDLGTTSDDLAAMARHTRFVYLEEDGLFAAAGRGLLRCVEACLEARSGSDSPGLAGLRVSIQGCGGIGGAMARALAPLGVELSLADLDATRARLLAEETGGKVVEPEEALTGDADIVAPCAAGGVLTPDVASRIRAWGVCGGANNQLSAPGVGETLARRGILFVPDFIASAGAVIEGAGRVVMGLEDRTPLVDRLRETALAVLEEAKESAQPTTPIAERLARERIERRSRERSIHQLWSEPPSRRATCPPSVSASTDSL